MRKEYEEVLRRVGIKVLDVYRFKDKDVVRFLYNGKVYVVDLRKYYDIMKPEDLANILLSQVT